MIIVEGMDNSGKTTLAEHLAEKFKLPLMHSPKIRENMIQDALTILTLNPNAVMDRFSVISEVIYGPTLRRKIIFDTFVTRWIFYMDKLAQCKPLIFYCRPPDEKIFDYGDREQMEGVKEHDKELLGAYDALMDSWAGRLLIMKYDFRLPNAWSFTDYAVETYLLRRRMDNYEY